MHALVCLHGCNKTSTSECVGIGVVGFVGLTKSCAGDAALAWLGQQEVKCFWLLEALGSSIVRVYVRVCVSVCASCSYGDLAAVPQSQFGTERF